MGIPSKVKNILGERYGKLQVVRYTEDRKGGSVVWECLCDCGNHLLTTSNHLNSGDTKSCGCYSKTFEGTSKKWKYVQNYPEYISYQAMRRRCYSQKDDEYFRYGGRGIAVCDRWLELNGQGFLNFMKDLGEKPDNTYSLDRINPDGNYEPSNCRWATKTEQSYNQRLSKRNKSGVAGVRFDDRTNKWRVRIQKDNTLLFDKYFEDFEEAIDKRRELEKMYYDK